jgi:S1-C subfamily serine protease
MNKLRNSARTPLGSAVIGGLIVAVVGLIAIAAGWVQSSPSSTNEAAALAPAPLPQQAVQHGATSGGLTVDQIYTSDSPGVAFVQSTLPPQAPTPFNPFGGSGGGTATGTGFVIDHAGHILTNAHVVNGASKIEVTLGRKDSSTPMPAQVVGKDTSTDVAVLKVNAPASELHPLPLGDSSQVKVGDPVVAIGNPFGLDRTVTAGIVSALQRQIQAPNNFQIDNVIQTDASINPGNSGGPLIDANGRVIGINSQIESQSGGNVGIGFAVPINTARDDAKQILATGSVQHAYLGISGTNLTPQLAGILNLPVKNGALVQAVVPNSPADKAGIKGGSATVSINGQQVRAGGDVITAVDGKKVTSMDDVVNDVATHNPGDQLTLTVDRHGQSQDVTVTLQNRPANAPQ